MENPLTIIVSMEIVWRKSGECNHLKRFHSKTSLRIVWSHQRENTVNQITKQSHY